MTSLHTKPTKAYAAEMSCFIDNVVCPLLEKFPVLVTVHMCLRLHTNIRTRTLHQSPHTTLDCTSV